MAPSNEDVILREIADLSREIADIDQRRSKLTRKRDKAFRRAQKEGINITRIAAVAGIRRDSVYGAIRRST